MEICFACKHNESPSFGVVTLTLTLIKGNNGHTFNGRFVKLHPTHLSNNNNLSQRCILSIREKSTEVTSANVAAKSLGNIAGKGPSFLAQQK